MKKIFLNGIYLLFALSGVFQLFLLPGLAWNVLFPFLQIALLLLSIKFLKDWTLLKICVAIIGVVTLVDFGLVLYSNSNTKSIEFKKELKVMSYNLYFKNKDLTNTTSIIKNANPDILMVQELTPKWNSKLNKEIGFIYKYKLVHPLNGTHGIGIYSKYPIFNPILLTNSSKKPFAQIADIKINGKKSQIINTHLASPAIAVENQERFFSLFLQNYKIRKKQIIQLNKIAQKNANDYEWQLLIGDMNTLQSEPIFKRLKLKWVNSISHPTRWMKFNFPNSGRIRPFLTLDYILGRGQMEFINSDVLTGGRSDHLAITAKIKI